MDPSKFQKPLAYAYRPPSAKSSLQEQHKKVKRNSTGNLYQQIIQQSRSEDKSYYQSLIKKNEKEEQRNAVENLHSRKKSNAEIVIENARERMEKTREERETMGKQNKAKLSNDNSYIQQITPKNAVPLNKRTKGRNQNSTNFSNVALISSYKQELERSDQSFLDHLNNYLEDLSENSDLPPQLRCNQKLSETLKIGGREGQAKLMAKLQQFDLKIKELKLKNYYQQKEINKHFRKEAKMNDTLYEMFDEIASLKKKLALERKERMKLESIIENFDLRRGKPERRTIGKHYQLRNEDPDNQFNSQSEYQKEYGSSFREFMMKKSLEKGGKRLIDDRNGVLDSEKVQKMFRSNYNSDDEDQ